MGRKWAAIGLVLALLLSGLAATDVLAEEDNSTEESTAPIVVPIVLTEPPSTPDGLPEPPVDPPADMDPAPDPDTTDPTEPESTFGTSPDSPPPIEPEDPADDLADDPADAPPPVDDPADAPPSEDDPIDEPLSEDNPTDDPFVPLIEDQPPTDDPTPDDKPLVDDTPPVDDGELTVAPVMAGPPDLSAALAFTQERAVELVYTKNELTGLWAASPLSECVQISATNTGDVPLIGVRIRSSEMSATDLGGLYRLDVQLFESEGLCIQPGETVPVGTFTFSSDGGETDKAEQGSLLVEIWGEYIA